MLDTSSGNTTGTIEYNSPERISDNPNSLKEDVWALGIILY
jgi:serine/threonine protein kinase